ncbi:hypothetical protein NLI06_002747 [Salmonella enterica]|nr:hypothetical protein [Salmonella enterica]
MAAVLDELVLALDIESKDFTAGEQAAHAALDRLTAAMERVADVFELGQKQALTLIKLPRVWNRRGSEPVMPSRIPEKRPKKPLRKWRQQVNGHQRFFPAYVIRYWRWQASP